MWRFAVVLAFLVAGGCQRTPSCDALAQHVAPICEREDAQTRRIPSLMPSGWRRNDDRFSWLFGDYPQQLRRQCEAGKLTDEIKRCFMAARDGRGVNRCGSALE